MFRLILSCYRHSVFYLRRIRIENKWPIYSGCTISSISPHPVQNIWGRQHWRIWEGGGGGWGVATPPPPPPIICSEESKNRPKKTVYLVRYGQVASPPFRKSWILPIFVFSGTACLQLTNHNTCAKQFLPCSLHQRLKVMLIAPIFEYQARSIILWPSFQGGGGKYNPYPGTLLEILVS